MLVERTARRRSSETEISSEPPSLLVKWSVQPEFPPPELSSLENHSPELHVKVVPRRLTSLLPPDGPSLVPERLWLQP